MYGPPITAVNGCLDVARLHRQRGIAHINEDEDDGDNDNDVLQCESRKTQQIGYSIPNKNSHELVVVEGDVMEGVEAARPHALHGSELSTSVPSAVGDGSVDQLTLSFEGEIYVFDAVSPEKVQAVLLLLGGYEVPSAAIPSSGISSQNHRNIGDYPGKSSLPQRAASLSRFREKRKERCYEKKIRYNVRKEVALRMQRKKGQFTSAKTVSDEAGSSSADGNGSSGQEEHEASCKHCGISSKCTPMMRRGPDGPRTLCNACGLKWANKGVLRDLTKVPPAATQDQHTTKHHEGV